jgi:hypothetical protein
MSITLHRVEELRVYCGPGALIAITGKRLPEVRSAINSARGMRDNQGVTRMKLIHLEDSLTKLNTRFEKTVCTERTTLSSLAATTLKKDVRYIVYITGHYVTILNGFLIDNQYRFGTDVDDCRWARKHVKAFLEIKE